MSDRDHPPEPYGRRPDPPSAPGAQPAPPPPPPGPPPPAWSPAPDGSVHGAGPQAAFPGAGNVSSEDRNWATGAHIGSFVAAYVALGLLAPLIVMMVKGNDSPFIRRHAVESLNFQLSVLIYAAVGSVVAVVLAVITLGLGLLVILPIAGVFLLAYVVLVVIGTVKASRGEDYRYPLTLRIIS